MENGYLRKKYLTDSQGRLLYKTINGTKTYLYNPIYLLDEMFSGETQVAFSTFKLKDSADLSLRLRRTSDQEVIDLDTVTGGVDVDDLNTFDDGSNIQVPIWYDQSGNGNHATQTTAANQPYLNDYIGNNLSIYVPYPNWASLRHNTITYTSGDTWSLSVLLNWDGYSIPARRNQITYTSISGGYFARSQLFLNFNWGYQVTLYNQSSVSDASIVHNSTLSRELIGKNSLLTITADGPNGIGKLYLNGNLVTTNTNRITDVVFEYWFRGGNNYNGSINYIRIQNGIMSDDDVMTEYKLINKIFPDIFNVKIGSQIWSTNNATFTMTPNLGYDIPNVIPAVNEELMGDVEFLSASTWTLSGNVIIENGEAIFNETGTTVVKLYQLIPITISGCVIKVRYSITEYTSGSINAYSNNWTSNTLGISRNSIGEFTEYFNTTNRFGGGGGVSGELGLISTNGFVGKIGYLSVEQVGWSQLDEAHDWYVSNGDSEIIANRKCMAWCYHDNDTNTGAIYGKLYNWYAIQAIQEQITAKGNWGWRIPTQEDYDILINYLGGEEVAGGKLKKEGTKYWNSPNEGTNESGFSAIGAGYRSGLDGEFYGLKTESRFWALDEPPTDTEKLYGYSLRLIKE